MGGTKKSSSLGHIADAAIELLKKHPNGLTMAQMRTMLNATAENQEHFNRRVRHIRKRYFLPTVVVNTETVYVLGEPKPDLPPGSGQISEKLRAAVLHAAHGRCQMCGRTVKEDGIKLQADHRVPDSWGGPTSIENLWALCEECNRGKRNFFSSFDPDEMREVVQIKSVQARIAHFLRLHLGKPVPSYAVQAVANVIDQQDDWQKRTRELRYPGIDLDIEVTQKKKPKGGRESFYRLKNWIDLPADFQQIIRNHNKKKKDPDEEDDSGDA